MQIGDNRPVRVCQGGQQASIQPAASIIHIGVIVQLQYKFFTMGC